MTRRLSRRRFLQSAAVAAATPWAARLRADAPQPAPSERLRVAMIGVTGQGATMLPGSEPRRILHGRHENQTIHDEVGMRHYYNEWGKWMNRLPSDPDQPYLAPLPAAAAE